MLEHIRRNDKPWGDKDSAHHQKHTVESISLFFQDQVLSADIYSLPSVNRKLNQTQKLPMLSHPCDYPVSVFSFTGGGKRERMGRRLFVWTVQNNKREF